MLKELTSKTLQDIPIDSKSYKSSRNSIAGGDDFIIQFKEHFSEVVNRNDFLQSLKEVGLWEDDPRLTESIARLKLENEEMTFETFRSCIKHNIILIDRALSGEFVIPEFPSFTREIADIYNSILAQKIHGGNSNHNPELEKMDPSRFGISLCTTSGQRYVIGDAGLEITLSSMIWPMLYCLCVKLYGVEKVHQHIGREPSPDDFNALSLNENGKPHNPFIDAGGLMLCSLYKPELALSDKFDSLMSDLESLAGNAEIGYSNTIYLAESTISSARIRALAYFMREHNAFPEGSELMETLDFYFQCVSIQMSPATLAVFGGLLANGGICPITAEKILDNSIVRNCLSICYTCGLHDFSGEFAFNIGLPAKGSISGLLLVVVPNLVGFVTCSPGLAYKCGKISSRGLQFWVEMVNRYNFHQYDSISRKEDEEKGHKTVEVKVDNRQQNTFQKDVAIMKLNNAALKGDINAIRRLFLGGCDINEYDYDKRTALHIAASENQLDVIKLLIGMGVDVNPVDRWGSTPLDDCFANEHFDCAKVLSEYGAIVRRTSNHTISSECPKDLLRVLDCR